MAEMMVQFNPQLIDQQDSQGKTALMHLINNFGAVKFLLAHKAEVNAMDSKKNTALLLADNVEVARYLLENGADVNIVGKNKMTFLIRAVQFTDQGLVEKCLKKLNQSLINIKYNDFASEYIALHYAANMMVNGNDSARKIFQNIAEILLRAGASPTVNCCGEAVSDFSNDCVKELLEKTTEDDLQFSMDL